MIQPHLKLVAVIDLLDGAVVHARRGDRASYAPVRSVLCEGSSPAEVARALLRLHAFSALYIADLDAIQRRGSNRHAIAQIARVADTTPLWIDCGIAGAASYAAFRRDFSGDLQCVPVVGSESLMDRDWLAQLNSQHDEWVLSLDHRGDTQLGLADLFTDTALWPGDVLAMNLARVGSGVDGLGPDLALIHKLHSLSPPTRVFASGGVRNAADLHACAQAGASGALLASCLHDGSLIQSPTALAGIE